MPKHITARRSGSIESLLTRLWELRPELKEQSSDTIRAALTLAILYLERETAPRAPEPAPEPEPMQGQGCNADFADLI